MIGNLPGLGHLRSLLTPLLTLAFLVSQPRQWWLVLAFAAASFAMDGLAEFGRPEKRQPPARRDGRLFDALVYVLFALHWVNLFLTLRLVGEIGWVNLQAPVALLLILLCSSHAVIGGLLMTNANVISGNYYGINIQDIGSDDKVLDTQE